MGKRPFQNLGPNERRNLALAAVFAFYTVYVGMGLHWNNLFTALGTDYLAFWSAAYLANTEGYAHAYDLEALRRVQDPWVPDPTAPSIVFTPIPAPIFPIFLPIFQLFALLPANWSFLVWTILNVILLIIYWHFWVQSAALESSVNRRLWMIALSFPVFWTLVWGQVNFLLLVCIGEFLRAMRNGKPFRAGVWLGGLWLKPQTLILIAPALLLQRSWKALSGLVVASLGVVGASIGLGGLQAMRRLANLWLGYASGLPTNDPQWMINWRMIGIHLSSLLGPEVGWGIALAGLVLTVVAALYLWWRPVSPSSPRFGVALLGTMAATCAATWHSHLHMMVIMIPPLLYLLRQRCLPHILLDIWLLLIPSMMLMGLLLDLIWKLCPPSLIYSEELMTTRILLSIGGFLVNICLFLWALCFIYFQNYDKHV